MNNSVNQMSDELQEGRKDTIGDFFARFPFYCVCGYGDDKEYNYLFYKAVCTIGNAYGEGKGSDYHRGVSVIVRGLKDQKVSKRQVKVLRKKLSRRGGYAYVLPFTFPQILLLMIDLLEKIASKHSHEMGFLSDGNGHLYKEHFFGKQCMEVQRAATAGRTKVVDLSNRLGKITTIIDVK